MKWKAASPAEAGRVLGDIARHGYRVIEALDVHCEAHLAKNDKTFSQPIAGQECLPDPLESDEQPIDVAVSS